MLQYEEVGQQMFSSSLAKIKLGKNQSKKMDGYYNAHRGYNLMRILCIDVFQRIYLLLHFKY